MKTLLAIDPSWSCTGWAYFIEGKLDVCGFIKEQKNITQLVKQMGNVWYDTPISSRVRVVIELPVIRPQRVERAEPNDLMKVAFVAGICAGVFAGEVETISPQKWKGNRPKKVDNPYTLSLLSAAERQKVPKNDNTIDAVGIGLWALKRR